MFRPDLYTMLATSTDLESSAEMTATMEARCESPGPEMLVREPLSTIALQDVEI
jgi:hypothetical protein